MAPLKQANCVIPFHAYASCRRFRLSDLKKKEKKKETRSIESDYGKLYNYIHKVIQTRYIFHSELPQPKDFQVSSKRTLQGWIDRFT